MELILDIGKVFCLAVLIDLMWVLYILATSQKRRVLSALASMGIGGPALFGTLEVVENNWMAIPYLFGLGIGTIVGMHVHERYIEKDVIRLKSD